jgi:hypothetical protein
MEQRHHKGKRVWVWVIGVVGALLLILGAAWLFMKNDLAKPPGKSKLKPLLTNQFKKMILEASDSLYQVKYKTFDFNTKSGNGLITDFELVPDTTVFNRLLQEKRAPNYLLYYKAERIKLIDFGFVKADSITKFKVAKIIIMSPLMSLRTKYHGPQADDTTFKEKMFFKLANKLFKHMEVNEIVMPNTNLTWVNNNRMTERRTNIRANLYIKGFSTQPGDKGIIVKINEYRHSPPDSLYDIVFKNIRYASAERRVTVKHVSVLPRYNKTKFNEVAKLDKDRYHFEMDGISMNNISTENFVKRQEITMSSYNIKDSWVEVYKDYNWPKRKVIVRRNVYPNDKLRLMAIDVGIDTMRMYHGTFYHTIFPQRSKQTARLVLTNMSSTYYNVTNIERRINKNPFATVVSRALVMGAGPMRSKFVFNLKDKNGSYTVHNTIGPINGKALNPLLKPLGMMEVKEGVINRMVLDMSADEYKAKGKIDMYYNGLKINMLKRDKDADTLKNMGFVSFLTNAALPNSNPGKNGKFREGPINTTREAKDSFFGFLWKSMLDGTTSAVMGYDQEKKKPKKNLLIKVGEAIAGPKDKDRTKSNKKD